MRKGRWSEDELGTLVDKYPEMYTRDLAYLLNRTVNSVFVKARKLDLEKSYRHLQRMGSECATGKRKGDECVG
jgi:hypothetical protein